MAGYDIAKGTAVGSFSSHSSIAVSSIPDGWVNNGSGVGEGGAQSSSEFHTADAEMGARSETWAKKNSEFVAKYIEKNLSETRQYKVNSKAENVSLEEDVAARVNKEEAADSAADHKNVVHNFSGNTDEMSFDRVHSDSEKHETFGSPELSNLHFASESHSNTLPSDSFATQGCSQNDFDALNDTKTYPFNPDAKVFVPKAISNKNLASVMIYGPQVHSTILRTGTNATLADTNSFSTSSAATEVAANSAFHPSANTMSVLENPLSLNSQNNMLRAHVQSSLSPSAKLVYSAPVQSNTFGVASGTDSMDYDSSVHAGVAAASMNTAGDEMSNTASLSTFGAIPNISHMPTESVPNLMVAPNTLMASMLNNSANSNNNFSYLDVTNEAAIGNATHVSQNAYTASGSASASRNSMRVGARPPSQPHAAPAAVRPQKPRYASAVPKLLETGSYAPISSGMAAGTVASNMNSIATSKKAVPPAKIGSATGGADVVPETMHYSMSSAFPSSTQSNAQPSIHTLSPTSFQNTMQPLSKMMHQPIQQAMRKSSASMRPTLPQHPPQAMPTHPSLPQSQAMPQLSSALPPQLIQPPQLMQHNPSMQQSSSMQHSMSMQPTSLPPHSYMHPHLGQLHTSGSQHYAIQQNAHPLNQSAQSSQRSVQQLLSSESLRNSFINAIASSGKGTPNDATTAALANEFASDPDGFAKHVARLLEDMNLGKDAGNLDASKLMQLKSHILGLAKDKSFNSNEVMSGSGANVSGGTSESLRLAEVLPHPSYRQQPSQRLRSTTSVYGKWEKIDFSGVVKGLGENFPVVECGGELYAYSNKGAAGAASELFVCDPKHGGGHHWHRVHPRNAPPQIRSNVDILTCDNKLYLFNGRLADGANFSTLWEFDTALSFWTRYDIQPHSQLLLKRQDYSVVFCEETLYLFGGVFANQAYKWLFVNDLWRMNLGALKWEQLCEDTGTAFDEGGEELASIPRCRAGHTAVVYDRSIYIFGGTNTEKELGDLFAYSTVTFQWTRIIASGCSPHARYGHSASLNGDRMILFGGFGANRSFLAGNAVVEYDMHELYFPKMTWTQIVVKGGLSPSPRFRHFAAMLDGYLYIFGGKGNSKLLPGNAAKLNDASAAGERGGKIMAAFTDSFRIYLGLEVDTDLERVGNIAAGNSEVAAPSEEAIVRSGDSHLETASREPEQMSTGTNETVTMWNKNAINAQQWKRYLDGAKSDREHELHDKIVQQESMISQLCEEVTKLTYTNKRYQRFLLTKDAEKQDLLKTIQTLRYQINEMKNAFSYVTQGKSQGGIGHRPSDNYDDVQRRHRDFQQGSFENKDREWVSVAPYNRSNKFGGYSGKVDGSFSTFPPVSGMHPSSGSNGGFPASGGMNTHLGATHGGPFNASVAQQLNRGYLGNDAVPNTFATSSNVSNGSRLNIGFNGSEWSSFLSDSKAVPTTNNTPGTASNAFSANFMKHVVNFSSNTNAVNSLSVAPGFSNSLFGGTNGFLASTESAAASSRTDHSNQSFSSDVARKLSDMVGAVQSGAVSSGNSQSMGEGGEGSHVSVAGPLSSNMAQNGEMAVIMKLLKNFNVNSSSSAGIIGNTHSSSAIGNEGLGFSSSTPFAAAMQSALHTSDRNGKMFGPVGGAPPPKYSPWGVPVNTASSHDPSGSGQPNVSNLNLMSFQRELNANQGGGGSFGQGSNTGGSGGVGSTVAPNAAFPANNSSSSSSSSGNSNAASLPAGSQEFMRKVAMNMSNASGQAPLVPANASMNNEEFGEFIQRMFKFYRSESLDTGDGRNTLNRAISSATPMTPSTTSASLMAGSFATSHAVPITSARTAASLPAATSASSQLNYSEEFRDNANIEDIEWLSAAADAESDTEYPSWA